MTRKLERFRRNKKSEAEIMLCPFCEGSGIRDDVICDYCKGVGETTIHSSDYNFPDPFEFQRRTMEEWNIRENGSW